MWVLQSALVSQWAETGADATKSGIGVAVAVGTRVGVALGVCANMASTVSSMICCTSTVGVGSSWPSTSGTGVADGGGTAAIRGGGFSGVEVNNHSTRSAIIHITRIDVRIARRRRIGTDHITTLLAFDERFGDGGDASLCGVDDGGLVAPLIGCTGAGCAWGICRSPGPVVGSYR